VNQQEVNHDGQIRSYSSLLSEKIISSLSMRLNECFSLNIEEGVRDVKKQQIGRGYLPNWSTRTFGNSLAFGSGKLQCKNEKF